MQLGAPLGTAGAARTETSIPAPGRFYSLLPLTLVSAHLSGVSPGRSKTAMSLPAGEIFGCSDINTHI